MQNSMIILLLALMSLGTKLYAQSDLFGCNELSEFIENRMIHIATVKNTDKYKLIEEVSAYYDPDDTWYVVATFPGNQKRTYSSVPSKSWIKFNEDIYDTSLKTFDEAFNEHIKEHLNPCTPDEAKLRPLRFLIESPLIKP